MNVFVLCTGRCGSLTFFEACRHITNFTAGHEARMGVIGPGRVEYRPGHIEIDNRLSWFLGLLDNRYGPDPFYVHLRRDPAQVAASFLRRWDYGIIRAFAHDIVPPKRSEWTQKQKAEACRFYVASVTANIQLFLRDKPMQMDFPLESASELFPLFWERIGAQGDLGAALAEWDRRYNASKPGTGGVRESAVRAADDPRVGVEYGRA